MLFRGGRQAAPVPSVPYRCGLLTPTLRQRSPGARLCEQCVTAPPRPVVSPATPLEVLRPRCQAVQTRTVASAVKRNAAKTAVKRAKRVQQKAQPPKPEPALTGPPFVASPEQQLAIDTVLAGRNLFLTGCAGTGKSATLLELRLQLLKTYGSREEYERNVAVVAMTGLAATIVGGVTLHSLLKLGLASTFSDFDRMLRNDDVQGLLLELRTLVLDEAGMMSAELLQALDHYLTLARTNAASRNLPEGMSEEERERLLAPYNKPFGGLQLILSGDFFQLAPIENKGAMVAASQKDTPRGHGANLPAQQPFRNRGFMFQAPVFLYGGFTVVELTKVFRQDDEGFVQLLNAVRCDTELASRQAVEQLRATCSRPLNEEDGIRPTLLFSKNADVKARNTEELAELPGPQVSFRAEDSVYVTHEPPASVYEKLVREKLLTAAELEDVTRDLEKAEPFMGTHERTLAALRQPAASRAIQLCSEWRGNARKHLREVAEGAGGLFRDCQAERTVDLKDAAQVMLVRNMDLDANLANGSRGVVVGFAELDPDEESHCRAIAARMDLQSMLLSAEEEMDRWLYKHGRVPVVKFTNGTTAKVPPAVFTAVVPGYGVCVRVQVPLKLAWAITVHKSQGMTLDRVSINLGNFFGHGMLYTALSRAKGLEGLHLEGTADRTMDSRVVQWWNDFRAGRRCIPGKPPSDGQWCWQDPKQPVLGKPQNPQAELWFKKGPEAFFAWQEAEPTRLEAEAAARQLQQRAEPDTAEAARRQQQQQEAEGEATAPQPHQELQELAEEGAAGSLLGSPPAASVRRQVAEQDNRSPSPTRASGGSSSSRAASRVSSAAQQLAFLLQRPGAVKKAELKGVMQDLQQVLVELKTAEEEAGQSAAAPGIAG